MLGWRGADRARGVPGVVAEDRWESVAGKGARRRGVCIARIGFGRLTRDGERSALIPAPLHERGEGRPVAGVRYARPGAEPRVGRE
ncbi:MAG: hypothetical protein M1314_03060 [Firmicutes bacterium]|nr:hypothetical protein [Bacillota bacterium]